MFWLLIKCECCDSPARPARRQATAYVDDELNWVLVCDDCFSVREVYWASMWEDHYRGVM